MRLIANRTRFRDLLDRHARGVITPEAFGAGAARIFDDVRTGWTEFMAIWIETDSGKIVASSGEASLVARFAGPDGPRVPVAPDSSMVELPRPVGRRARRPVRDGGPRQVRTADWADSCC